MVVYVAGFGKCFVVLMLEGQASVNALTRPTYLKVCPSIPHCNFNMGLDTDEHVKMSW